MKDRIYVIRLNSSDRFWSAYGYWTDDLQRAQLFTSKRAASDQRRALKMWPKSAMRIEAGQITWQEVTNAK